MAHRAGHVIAVALLWAAAGFAQALPRVLIIGDSISIGYTPFVKELLGGKAEVERVLGNAADTRNTLAHLDDWLAKGPYRVISFNCGLHDLKFDEAAKTHQVPLEEYGRNLPKIVEKLHATGARLVWVSTTPIDDLRHAKRRASFARYERDVEEYNAVARPLMKKQRIPVCDLHKVVVKGGAEKLLGKDGTHYTEEGYRLLAKEVAAAISRRLK